MVVSAAERLFERALGGREAQAGHHQRAALGKIDLAFRVHRRLQPLRRAAGDIHHQAVARPKHIIGTDGHVHGKLVRVAGAVFEQAHAEAFHRLPAPLGILPVEIGERRIPGVGIAAGDRERLRGLGLLGGFLFHLRRMLGRLCEGQRRQHGGQQQNEDA